MPYANCYPYNRSFSWHAKNGERRKTSEEIVSKSCWVCAINRPGVWTSYIGQTGCFTSFNPSRHFRAWTVCRFAGQNGARLLKMAREEIVLQPRSKVILRHAQQDFDTISSEVFLFSPFFACQGKQTSVIRVANGPYLDLPYLALPYPTLPFVSSLDH